jgi:outer membrane protein
LIPRSYWRWSSLAPLFFALLPGTVWGQALADNPSSAPVEEGTQTLSPEIDGEPADDSDGATVELSLSLEQAVRMALERNIQIQISREDNSIRRRETVIARAVFDPFFNLGATYAKNRDPSVSAIEVGNLVTSGIASNPSEDVSYSVGLGGVWLLGTEYNLQLRQSQSDRPAAASGGLTFFNPITSTSASVDLRQPLLKGAWYNVNMADIRIASNTAEISREELERITMETVFAVEQAYWELLFSEQNLEGKRKALLVADENLGNTRKKHAVGTMAAIDVTTAKSQKALRKVEVEEALLLLENSRDALLDLINQSGEQSLKERWDRGEASRGYDSVRVDCTTQPTLSGAPYAREEALRLAFLHLPAYKQNELNLKNQELRHFLAQNELLPSLDLLARWTQLGLEEHYQRSYRELEGGKFYDWMVGLEFAIPLSNRANRSRYRNARSEARKLLLDRRNLENQMVLGVDQALREVASLEQRVRDLTDSVRYHAELLEAERRKLEVGKSVAYTVSTIENDLVDQQTQALRTKADLQTAKARLYRVTGTTLHRYRIVVAQ